MSLVPNVRIDVPFAANKREDDAVSFFCAGDAGKTDTSAPLSTRNARLSRLQKTVMAPSTVDEEESVETPGVTTDPRLCRFPRLLKTKRRTEEAWE